MNIEEEIEVILIINEVDMLIMRFDELDFVIVDGAYEVSLSRDNHIIREWTFHSISDVLDFVCLYESIRSVI